MNKQVIFLLSVVALLLSCTREVNNQVILPGETITFTAGWSSTETRTTLQSDGTSVWWEPFAQVNLFFSNQASGKFTSANEQFQAVVDFQGSLPIAVGSVETENPPLAYWAVYPYDAANTCDGESVILSVPTNQTATAGTFANKMFPSIATSTNFYLAFYNVCGGVRFTVYNEGILSVSFKANNGEPLAGKVKVGFDGVPVVKNVIDGTDEVKVNAPDGGFIPGTYYYATLLPQTLAQGISLTFHRSDGKVATTSVENSITVNRSRFSKVDEKDKDLSFVDEGSSHEPTDAIVFADSKVKEKLVAAFDTNNDGELSYEEAAAVISGEDVKAAFGTIKTYKSFDEFQYFTGVTSIPASMFENWNLLSSISIPSSSYILGTSAFKGCLKLESLIIPNNIMSIGGGSFQDCSALKSIVLPDGLRTIGAQTFSGCTSLQEILIPNEVSQIGANAFYGCSSLSSISLPEKVKTLGEKAFYECTNLSSIVILGELSSIEEYTFYGCSKLQSIVIPDSVSQINGFAFSYCSGLSSLHIPSHVKKIGRYAFDHCTGLVSVNIEYGLSTIEEYAFESCSNLESINIPESVISIGLAAFWKCSSLVSVIIPESVSSIEAMTFRECSNLTSVVIPESVSKIAGGAFEACISLTDIMIPASVAIIEGNPFIECSSLDSIIVDSDNSVYDSRSNCNAIIETASGILQTGCKNTIIPDGITEIGERAFFSCSGLKSIRIPESVTSIGNSAFWLCSDLTSINIPEKVTSLEDSVLYGCSSLSSIIIPANVTIIKDRAFMNCSSLTSITLYPTNPPALIWGTYSPFQGCPYALTIYVPTQSLDSYKSSQYWLRVASRIQAIPE